MCLKYAYILRSLEAKECASSLSLKLTYLSGSPLKKPKTIPQSLVKGLAPGWLHSLNNTIFMPILPELHLRGKNSLIQ